MIAIFEQDGSRYRIDIPHHVRERTFENWCDFRQGEAKYLDAMEEDLATRTVLLQEALQHMVPGDLDQVPPYLPGDNTEKLIEEGYQVRVGDEISQLRLYAHTVVLIQDYQPERIPDTFKFKHRGKDFQIKSEPAARILTNRPLLTGEVIESLEYQRRSTAHMDHTPLDVGNIDYNLGLTEYAILVRQPNEKLPSGKAQRERFIRERKQLFKDIDLETVLAIRFFFINALLKYAQTPPSSSSGKVLQVQEGSGKTEMTRGSLLQWKPGRLPGGGFFTR